MSAFKQSSSSSRSLEQKYTNLQVFLLLEYLISNYHASSRKGKTEEFIWRCVWQFHKGLDQMCNFSTGLLFFWHVILPCSWVYTVLVWRAMLRWKTWFRCDWLLWWSCVTRWLLIVYKVSLQHFCIMKNSLHQDVSKLLCTLNHFRTQALLFDGGEP